MSRIAPALRSLVAAGLGAAVLSSAALFSTGLAAAATTGSLALTSGQSAYTSVEESTDGVVATSFVVPSTTARPVYLGLQFRSPKASEGYRTRVAIAANGTVRLGLTRVVGGKEQILLSEPIALTVKAGDRLFIEGSVTGTSPVKLQARAWTGTVKPAWQKSYTDTNAARLTTGTTVRAWGYLSGSAPTTKTTITYNPTTTTPAPAAPATTAPAPAAPATTAPAPAAPVSAPAAPVVSKPVVTGKPTATTTGPKSTTLKRHDGNITVTKAGTVLEGLDIHGFVTVKAANVIIRNSIVRGAKATTNAGVITNYGSANLLVEDVYIKPEHQSVWIDGVKGWNFTLNRVHVVGGVDNVKIHGDNVTIKNSLLESTVYYASDPNQGGGPTHNDNIQILKGTNLTLTGNTIRETNGFAIMNGAEQGNVTAKITNNWLDGGHCTVKLTHKKGWTQKTVITNNKFGPNRKIAKCVIQSYTGVTATAANNTFETTGKPVSIFWNNA